MDYIENGYSHRYTMSVAELKSRDREIKEQIISIINQSADQLQQGAKGMDLAKMIFDNLIKKNEDPTSEALTFLKDEIRQIF